MWFEIYRSGKLIKRGNDVLNSGLRWDSELMSVPTLSISLPIEYVDYVNGREEIKIFANSKCFWGIINEVKLNKDDETIDVTIVHVVHEWEYRQISINNAVKDGKVQFLFKSGADKVRKDGSIHICASNFECKPNATNFIELGKVEVWDDESGQIIENSVSYKLFERDDSGDEPSYTEISSLPQPESEDSTKTCYIRFYTSAADGLYVQVQIIVTSEPKEEIDELDIKNATVFDQLEDIYNDVNFAYPGWTIDYQDESENTLIDYVYSRQNKLDALTKTMELTKDLFWRVGFTNQKLIEIGKFGEEKNWMISVRPTLGHNISIVEEPTITYDFKNVVNVATVYSEKSASGMNSLTLREVYNDPELQEDGFPVVILRANVNDERDYTKYIAQFPSLAPNNELEYAVIDEESVALEDGHLIEGTFAFNDITAFVEEEDDEGETKEVTDKDRIEAAKTAYSAAIRKLKQARRSYKLELTTEKLPAEIQVGDKVRFIYDNQLWIFEECSSYFKFLLSYDDWFYVTKIQYDIDVSEAEVDTITLEKFLKIDRETKESV